MSAPEMTGDYIYLFPFVVEMMSLVTYVFVIYNNRLDDVVKLVAVLLFRIKYIYYHSEQNTHLSWETSP